MKVTYAFRNLLLATASLIPVAALAQPAGAADSAQSGVGDIVVTANRRTESIQNVPLTVAAVSAEGLAAAGVASTRGLEQVVPGLVMGTTATSTQPTLRGIGTRGSTTADESNVAMYLDGVYQPALSAGNFELLNVERVEVLKGPQGTLYGRNATGGAINVITSKPGDTMAMRFAVSYGRFNEVNAGGYVAVPLGDVVSFDVAANHIYREGYVKDLVRGGMLGDRNSTTVRARVRLRPSANVDIIAAFSHTDSRDDSPFTVQPLNGNTIGRKVNPAVLLPTDTLQYVGNVLPRAGFKQTDYNLQVDIDLGFASLQSASDYQKNTNFYTSDSDGTTVAGRDLHSDNDYVDAWSQELRLISKSAGRLQWIVGAMAYGSKAGTNLVVNNPGTQSLINGKQSASAIAGYAEGTYELLDKLFVTGGVRYSWEKRKFDPFVNTAKPQVEASFHSWTPRASIRYEIAPRTSVYFTYSQGFKSGLYNLAAAVTTPVKPETITSYEVGFKLQPASWLRANLAGFIYDYKNLQVTARLSGDTTSFLQNAGKAKIKGIDFDLTAAPVDGLNLNLAAEYLDAKFVEFTGAAINTPTVVGGIAVGGNDSKIADVSGNRLIRAPKLTLTAGFTYKFAAAGGLIKVAANANYNDGFFVEFGNRLRQPAYTLVNANLGWWTRDERFGVTLFGENLADERVVQYALISANQDGFSYRPPATYGVRLNGKF